MILIFIGIVLLLAFFIAPVLIVMNRKRLREMDEVVKNYHEGEYLNDEIKKQKYYYAKKKLIYLKSKILRVDRQSFSVAQDILESL